ncbi:MAG: radical SAM protein [Hungatella sp.]|nr:radical SAM protein [Hungatella sp.]
MKWEKPGHEFDRKYQDIINQYREVSLIIYGAGMMGGRIYDAVASLTELKVDAYFDKDQTKTQYKKLPVVHQDMFGQCLKDKKKVMVVLGLPDEEGDKVKKELISFYGLKKTQCKLYSEFAMWDLPIIALYQNNKVFLDTVSMIIIERCTLKCEKCAIMLPYFKEIRSYSFDKLKKEADALFKNVDFVGNFTLTGGEPLLYEDLVPIIQYIGDCYRARIGSFKIITNGTVIPSDKLIEVMCRYDMAADISDYTEGIPAIKDRLKKVRNMFEQSGIKTYFLSAMKWVDFGFEYVDNHYNTQKLQQFFDFCHTRCRGYIDGKLRYCINAYFARRTLNESEDQNNEFDILSMKNSIEEKRKLVEFDLGYNKSGFLEMCQHCNGTVEINQHFIEVGKQCGNH